MTARSADPVALLGGRYRIGQLIGRGGMAEVYRATDERLGREVAVKLFRPGVAAVEDLRRVRSEIRTLAALAHPGLVTLHDAADGDDGTPAYLVLELVRGSDLGALIRTGALSSAESVALVREVASTLAYIHARGIVHRDIKPENVLVARGEDGALHAKLADLGIARILGDSRLTEAGAVIGTAAYLSPEQVMGEEVGTEADVYALGLVLLEALTGRPAYEGGKLEQALARVNRPPEIPDWLDDADAVLIEDMTARDPADRPSARDTVTELAAWTSGDAPSEEDAQFGAAGAAVVGAARVNADRTEVLGAAAGTQRFDDDYDIDDDDIDEYDDLDGDWEDGDEANDVRTRVFAHPDPIESPRTEVLGSSGVDGRTEVLGHPRAEDPTAVLPVAGAYPGASHHGADDARTELLGAGPSGTPYEAPLSAHPVPAAPTERQLRRAESRRTAWRRVGVTVTVLAVLSGTALVAWPVLEGIAPAAQTEPPAYPTVENSLAGGVAALEGSVTGRGSTESARASIEAGILDVATTAAASDFDGTQTALDSLEDVLARAVLDDQLTGARYDTVRAALFQVRDGLTPAREEAAAEAERERLAAEEAERQRQAELERQAEAERQAELDRQAEEQRGGLGQTLDDLGQNIRDQFERWTQGF